MPKILKSSLLLAGLMVTVAATIGGILLGHAAGAQARHAPVGASRSQSAVVRETENQSKPYDLQFIDEMMMHHEGAIMSSHMMVDNSQHPDLRDLAGRIEQGQQQQINQMRAWRAQWYPDAPEAGGMDSMRGMMSGHMNGNGQGRMSASGMGGMMGSQGMMGNVDRMFLRMMIPHHQIAIDMSQDALQNAQHDELKRLAQQIIDDQSTQITEMEAYLQTWYGVSSTRGSSGPMEDMMRRMIGH